MIVDQDQLSALRHSKPKYTTDHPRHATNMAKRMFYSSPSLPTPLLMQFVPRIVLSAVLLTSAAITMASTDFSACPQFFAKSQPPKVAQNPTNRALCYDAFAVLHSGQSKTPVFVAQKLNHALVEDADEKRATKFFSDARLPAAERATLDDYKHSGWSRGHMAPAGDMPTAQAMAQSFSLANMVPQAAKHNGGAWAKSVEKATRQYAARARGDVFVITGPVYEPSIAASPGIGPGQVRVPKYLFKLVYDEDSNRAWAHWHLNDDATHGARPISYAELVKRTGIIFLPGVRPND